jgi:hypothetical protein
LPVLASLMVVVPEALSPVEAQSQSLRVSPVRSAVVAASDARPVEHAASRQQQALKLPGE